jgi:hypothetical protein
MGGILLLGAAFSGLGSPRAAVAQAPPVFDAGVTLPGQGGAEPSMAIDHGQGATRDNIYVSAIGGWGSSPPPGDPAGSGPVLWRSTDHGATFSPGVQFDNSANPNRGNDGDVAVAANGDVVVVDLNITHAVVQVSKDQGRTFGASALTAPEDDRPWLATHGSDVYVFYHDFAGELPGVCTSHDGGLTFLPCSYVSLTDPVIASNCIGNTNVAKSLVVDPTDGSINILFACSTLAQNLTNPPYGSLHDYYLAQSTDGGLTFTDYTVFKADVSGGKGPTYGNFWPAFAIDSAGNYYGVWAGSADDPQVTTNPYHIFLTVSKDHGHTWGAPIVVDRDPGGAGTHVEAAITAGTAGNIDVAWYGTPTTGEPNGVCESSAAGLVGLPPSQCPGGLAGFAARNAPAWDVYVAQSLNATAASPTFAQVKATSTPVHYGQLCVNGIVCGASDRSLLDFISLDLDCRGMTHVAYSANTKAEEAVTSNNGAANVRVANQVGGSPLGVPGSCSAPAAVQATPVSTASPRVPLPNTGSTPTPGVVALVALIATAAATALGGRAARGRG